MKTGWIVLGACLLLSTSVGAYAQKVTSDFDKTASFSNFKTYAWNEGTSAKSPLGERITQSIDKQLTDKGLIKVGKDQNPDLLVAYYAATDVETHFYTTGWRYWGTSPIEVEKIPVGTLGVNIGTPKERKYVWMSKATRTLSTKPEKVEKLINNAVKKMFKDFPPV
jgi:hypothetical protein